MSQQQMRRQRHRRTQRGMSLLEVIISTGLLVGGGGALLVGLSRGFLLVNYMTEQQMALQAAQGKLEELAATDFDRLATATDPAFGTDSSGASLFVMARSVGGAAVCMGEDQNCDGILSPGEVDTNGNGRADLLLLTGLTGMDPVTGKPRPGTGRLNIRIRAIPGETLAAATQLDLIVAASWWSASNRRCIGGEDRTCDGTLDTSLTPSEDANNNGILDAPVIVSTRVTRQH